MTATKTYNIDMARLPKHNAIIMDGNGRWAQQRGLHRIYGHQSGVEAVDTITTACVELGIKYLTLYAFSTENWNRPTVEVEALMSLLVKTIEDHTNKLIKNNVRLKAIGDLGRLPKETLECLQQCISRTSANTGLTLVLALSYSSRWEITAAVRQIAEKVATKEINKDEIDEQLVSNMLTTKDIPDPDLLIRTSGEERISNFLLWQLAYSELYFTPTLWPDFDKNCLLEAIDNYQNRERRFGKTSEQIKN